jgi:DNA-binding transcriptional LysR family regulator
MNLRLLSIVRRLVQSDRRELKLTLISSHTDSQVQALLQGTIQAGLLTLPVRNEALVVKSLVREPLAVVVPESHRLTSSADLPARELNGVPVILTPRQLHPGFHDHLYGLFKRVGYRPNVVQEVTTEAEALYMVGEGIGITFMKVPAIPPEWPGIAYRRFREPSLMVETGIAYRRDNRSSKILGFVTLVRRNVQQVISNSLFGQPQFDMHNADPRQMKLF